MTRRGYEGKGVRMDRYVLGLGEIDKTQATLVGGKGAFLGELSRIEGIRVPAGFCVTTNAYRRITENAPSLYDLLNRVSGLNPRDLDTIRTLSAETRETLKGIAIPDDVATAITLALARFPDAAAYAVRSSATAEDLPTASFAGQQDTYLNVIGPVAILQHISRCWASLFTERAVAYRLHNGFDQKKIQMAVVVQQMVFPEVAGVLFTADPVTSNRKVSVVEATFGLGEALVSGLVQRGHLQGTRRRGRSQNGRGQAVRYQRAANWRNAETGDRPGTPGAAGADRCAGRATRAGGSSD